MGVRVLKVDPDNPDRTAIAEAVETIRTGGLVIFPTETVYGLGADVGSPDAIDRVFLAKDRGRRHSLPIQIADATLLDTVTSGLTHKASVLARRFWPGPMTLVVPRGHNISPLVTGGKETVGVRVPAHPVALWLLRELGSPMIATSANLSGEPAPTCAAAAIDQIGEHVSLVLDAGHTSVGIASTVVDVTVDPPVILREGSIAESDIRKVLKEYEPGD
jgi:L-threonylcarbamoyladenylate synthase